MTNDYSSLACILSHMIENTYHMNKNCQQGIWDLECAMKNILGAQIRAARALLRWAAADLVRESGVSLATIHRAELVDGKTAMTVANASAIRRALENAGVELIEENAGGPGVRLRKPARTGSKTD